MTNLPPQYGPPISFAAAKRIMDAAEREAAGNGWPMAIAIVDSTGEEAIAAGGMGLRLITMPYMIALEGGIPIVKDGQVIGGIGVSGMQSSQDAEVARAGLAALE